MTDANWLPIAAALVGGGAAGAVITAVVTAYRARRQPIGHRIDVVPVFRPPGGAAGLEAAIAITHAGNTVTFQNLFLAEVQLANKGNRELDELSFGVTLGGDDRCIYAETTAPDRHHQVTHMTAVAPDTPGAEIDFTLKPFNRGDSYSFKLYIVIPEAHREPQKISLGTSSPVRFVAMPTAGEILARAASEATVNIGGIRVSMRR